jgi:hypothetical protein
MADAAPKYYGFHPITFEYAGWGIADPDPLDKGKWLIPANVTYDMPPATGPHQVACWYAIEAMPAEWHILPDARGQTWFTAEGTPVYIEFIGDPATKGYLEVNPIEQIGDTPDPGDLDAVHTYMINAESDRRMATGVVFNDRRYNFDAERAKPRIMGGATLAVAAIFAGRGTDPKWDTDPSSAEYATATPFEWIDITNTKVQMDANTMFAFGQAAAKWEQSHVFAARALKDMAVFPEDYRSDQYWPVLLGITGVLPA